ncbi:M protein [Amycolatopsis rhabdoformis]|uniref:M protein n=1 Tax=Amycolatopsis rhabdoformis TaxID=1448059 RepID=A0ABZ1HWC7_9PSEU|nr:M protein [Amycolatopsis rhabdoformis]WSE25938.1 M protein [Amycolatopsis rhabdoformis]
MAPETGEDLLSVEPRFEQAWRGFHRGQVKEFVAWAQEELRRVTAERDAAVHHVAQLSGHTRELRATIDRVSRTPIEPDALQERSRRMIELTREEASEIIARAKEKAEQTRLDAEAEAVRLTEQERSLVAATEEDRRRQAAAHAAFMRQAATERAAADEAAAQQRRRMEADLTEALHQRRTTTITELDTRRTTTLAELHTLRTETERELETARTTTLHDLETARSETHRDLEAARASTQHELDTIRASTLHELDTARASTLRELDTARAETHRELETARSETHRELDTTRTETLRDLDLQRTTTAHELAAQTTAAQADAEARVLRATEHATHVVTQAEARVAELAAVHHRLQTALTGTRELLASATAALDPPPDDTGRDTPVPVQRRKPALTEATPTG